MRLWLIPLAYVIVSTVCGFMVPRLEHIYLDAYEFDMSAASAQAFLSAVASGMIALTAIVFSVAFVMVQFSAIAYSPRLVLWFARDASLYHALGVFIATFFYSLATLAWVDRKDAGKVPAFSSLVVAVLLVISMLLFARLVQRLNNLQITNVLKTVGDRGRAVIRETFQRLDEMPADGQTALQSPGDLGPVTQIVTYSGPPCAIAELDIPRLVRQAQQARAIIALESAVGDTIIDGSPLLAVHGGAAIPERHLLRAIHLTTERTFEQDPKYPLRLLVDIAIKALSPAINDPTTAVQAIDQIEDLLRRLGRHELDAGYARDAEGKLRLVYPMPTWEDYLTLGFDEIRQYGGTSVQVMRRLRSALVELASIETDPARAEAVQRYLKYLDLSIETSPFNAEDRHKARQEDRQGLGLTRKRAEPKPPPA